MHPHDQTSMAGPYRSSPRSSSGGRYHKVITLLVYGRCLSSAWNEGKLQLQNWLICPSPRFWDNSGSELSNTSVRNPICLFSSFSQLKQIGLGFEPLNSRITGTIYGSNDAFGFSVMDPGLNVNMKQSFDIDLHYTVLPIRSLPVWLGPGCWWVYLSTWYHDAKSFYCGHNSVLPTSKN